MTAQAKKHPPRREASSESSGSQAKTESTIATDHEEIRMWVESHGGKPVQVRGTGSKGQSGILRIDFPGGAGEDRLEPISWDDWFKKFDERHLGFLYQKKKKSGEDSTFFKLVRRDQETGMKGAGSGI